MNRISSFKRVLLHEPLSGLSDNVFLQVILCILALSFLIASSGFRRIETIHGTFVSNRMNDLAKTPVEFGAWIPVIRAIAEGVDQTNEVFNVLRVDSLSDSEAASVCELPRLVRIAGVTNVFIALTASYPSCLRSEDVRMSGTRRTRVANELSGARWLTFTRASGVLYSSRGLPTAIDLREVSNLSMGR